VTVRLSAVRDRIEARDAGLDGSLFEDVSLAGARFADVNLAGSVLVNVDLRDVRIADAALDRMTIDGVPVTALLAAWDALRQGRTG
jgi:uncharacterized protein YjbI with pentapeptide repeats